MAEDRVQRRLAAILAADVVGYSSMMGADENGTLAALRQIWSETFNPVVAARHGRIVKMMGDGALVEFGSVVEAVECAVAIQRAMRERTDRASNRIPHRHQSRRDRHRRRRHIRRRRQRRGAARRPGHAGRHPCLRHGPRASERQDRRYLHRRRRDQVEEHRAAAQGVAMGRRSARTGQQARAVAHRARGDAVARGPAVPEYERRFATGVFRGRSRGGHHHRAGPFGTSP